MAGRTLRLRTLWLAIPVALALFGPARASASTGHGARLTKADHALIAKAIAARQPTVTLLLAGKPGGNASLARRLATLGATVAARDDDVAYLRAVVPVHEAVQAARLDGVVAASIDRIVPHADPTLPARRGPLTDPGPSTPPVNPYVPVGDVGAPQFVAAHPTWDGRGTTLGIVDDGVDLLTPELQGKVVDSTTTSSPDVDPTWVDMSARVTAAGGHFSFGGHTYLAANGKFRVGVLDEEFVLDGDLNRDGNPPGSSPEFAVLWNTDSNSVWVDTDQDRSFTDETAMTDYRVHQDRGVFGIDNPATVVRESVPFTVETDLPDKLVDINVEDAAGHGTSVASLAVGKGFFGGQANGAAPGAKLAVVRTDFSDSSIIEGILYLAKRDHVDAISISIGSPVGVTFNPESVVIDRVVNRFDIPVFAAAGNTGTAVNAVADPSASLDATSVASSVTRDTTRAVFGYDEGSPEGIMWDSSRGPTVDGALKPDVAAPGMSWVALPGWEDTGGLPGYEPAIGTSLASPIAAGAALLLLSAAHQTGTAAHADQLRVALYSSARRLAGFPVHAQGRGVVSTGAAWLLLQRKPKPVVIDASAPVDNAFVRAGFLADSGPGLYLREGWTAGKSGQAAVTLTRQTGGDRAIPYTLSLTGNDGTFSLPASTVKLAKGTPTAVQVSIDLTANGAHSAILAVDDPLTAGVDDEVGLMVIGSEQYSDANRFSITHSGAVANGGVADLFFDVPPDAFAWDYDLSSANGGELAWTVASPFGPAIRFGFPFDPTGFVDSASVGCWVESASANCAPNDWTSWEFAITTAFQAAQDTAYTLKTAVRGRAAVTPSPLVIDPADSGTTYDRTLTFSAGAIGVQGGAHGSDLGPLHSERPTLGDGDFLTRIVTVPPGTSRLTVEIDNAADPDADLDLFVDHCNDPDCNVGFSARSTTPSATEWVDIDNPDPGDWFIEVDGFFVPSGSTAFDFAHVEMTPADGSVTVDDTETYHPAHSTWMRSIHVTPRLVGGPLRGYVRLPGGWTKVDVRNVH